MKHIFILTACLAMSTASNAQSFPSPADHPVWKVGVWYYWTADCESYYWKYGKTLDICGTPYTEVIECNYTQSNCSTKGYVRVRDKKVYARKTDSCSEKEQLMYDFGLPVTGKYVMAYNLGSYDSTQAWIEDKQQLSYLNIDRLTQSVAYHVDPPMNSYTDYMSNIEGIGSDIHPFFPLACFGDFCETNLQLMEFRENSVVKYAKIPVFPLPCKRWLETDKVSEQPYLSLYPNPSSDLINITAAIPGTLSISLYDASSKCVLQQDFTGTTTLDIGIFAKGLYLYEVKSNDGSYFYTGKIARE